MNKKNICFALVILLVFVSTYMLAKYTSTISGSGSSTNIAKWDVSRDYSDNSVSGVELVAGNETLTQNYVLKVKSISDVSASYKIKITGVPDGIEISIDNGQYVTPVNGEIIFESNNYKINLNDNDKEKTHTLTFKALLDSDFSNVESVGIDLEFKQID